MKNVIICSVVVLLLLCITQVQAATNLLCDVVQIDSPPGTWAVYWTGYVSTTGSNTRYDYLYYYARALPNGVYYNKGYDYYGVTGPICVGYVHASAYSSGPGYYENYTEAKGRIMMMPPQDWSVESNHDTVYVQ